MAERPILDYQQAEKAERFPVLFAFAVLDSIFLVLSGAIGFFVTPLSMPISILVVFGLTVLSGLAIGLGCAALLMQSERCRQLLVFGGAFDALLCLVLLVVIGILSMGRSPIVGNLVGCTGVFSLFVRAGVGAAIWSTVSADEVRDWHERG